jgi:hypothetical protein
LWTYDNYWGLRDICLLCTPCSLFCTFSSQSSTLTTHIFLFCLSQGFAHYFSSNLNFNINLCYL